MVGALPERGWAVLPFDARTKSWAEHAWHVGQQVMHAPEMAHWWVCEGTWFVGVDALPTTEAGGFENGPELPGALLKQIVDSFGPIPPLHRAQMSVVRPGYPKPRNGESDAAFRFRQKRDAAHVDGLIRQADGARRLEEPHAWILGLPLTENAPHEAPLVVWEGSHKQIQTALTAALSSYPPEDWGKVDLREAYQAARRQVFETCKRIPLTAKPGEAILLHRQLVHGVSPWQALDTSQLNGFRSVAYFRPLHAGGPFGWVKTP